VATIGGGRRHFNFEDCYFNYSMELDYPLPNSDFFFNDQWFQEHFFVLEEGPGVS
jgi:hypothetical protein